MDGLLWQHLPDKQCETCGAVHKGLFGSGRFCCFACSRSAGGKAKKGFDGKRFDRTGIPHNSRSLSKMKDARKLWWEKHECNRKQNDKGQFTK